MIERYAVKDQQLVPVGTAAEKSNIIGLITPTDGDISEVAKSTGAPVGFIRSACDKDERPRIESDECCHLMILRIPQKDKTHDTPFFTVALGIIITKDCLIFVSPVKLSLHEIINCKIKFDPDTQRIGFLCSVFLHFARLYLKDLRQINNEVSAVEKEIHHSLTNEMLIRMFNLEKCLIYFTTSIRGHDLLWSKLKKIKNAPLTEDEQDIIEDVQIEFKQAYDLAEIYSDVLSGTMDAFASIISNNVNDIMRVLTIVTVVFMVPNLVYSFFGMNVDIPGISGSNGVWIPVILSIFLSLLTIFILLKKRFF